MPSQALIDRNLRTPATLWRLLGKDSDGKPSWGEPEPIQTRWEEKVERVQTDQHEKQLTGMQAVWCSFDVAEGDRLFEGVSAEEDPEPIEGCVEVLAFVRTPHLYFPDTWERIAYV